MTPSPTTASRRPGRRPDPATLLPGVARSRARCTAGRSEGTGVWGARERRPGTRPPRRHSSAGRRRCAPCGRFLADADAGRGRLVSSAATPGSARPGWPRSSPRTRGTCATPVLWGRAREDDGAPPFWPWVQVLRQCAAAPVRRPGRSTGSGRTWSRCRRTRARPGLRDEFVDPRSARFRLFDRVVDALRDHAADRATVLILDDLHRADPPSLALLRFPRDDSARGRTCSSSGPTARSTSTPSTR